MKRKLNEHDVPETRVGGNGEMKEKVTFASLGLDARVLQAVTKEKFAVPTAVQIQAIPLALGGKDILARAETGSGKTLAYLLPLIHSILVRKATTSARRTSSLILVPTRELANQVAAEAKKFTAFCSQDVRVENITRKEDASVTKARLLEAPDIVIATPSRASQHINGSALNIDQLTHLVIDEADLVLSYGYEDDLSSLAAALPSGAQTILMSATLSTSVDSLTSTFLHDPVTLDLSSSEADAASTLTQYVVKCAEDEKFLLIYAIFKLQLIMGKMIVFVSDIDRCYRLKLFLEQFGVRSCVLNSELPVNSRLHVVEEFNRGVYDVIVAADENGIVGDITGGRKRRNIEDYEGDADEAADEQVPQGVTAIELGEGFDGCDKEGEQEVTESNKLDVPTNLVSAPKKRKIHQDREYGVSRGIDFQNVACVLNFDLPTTSKSYTHRVGRTARAGKTGMALSFVIPKDQYRKHRPTSIEACKNDEDVLAKIVASQEKRGQEVKDYAFDMAKLDGFRYRLADALRAVTRIAVREARTKELRQELIKSEKLKRHFEENPDELRHLRHDMESHSARVQPHLRHVPDYLLPGGKAAVVRDVGFVGLRKDEGNGVRRRHAFNKSRGKGKQVVRGRRGELDVLKTFNARGKGK